MVAHWMKLIDKYLLRTMLVPFGYCVGSFVLIYIVYDLFDNLSDFVHAGTPFFQVIRFYTFLLPSVFILIVPISILLAVLYGLSQLTKNNELTAMRASGMSLYRLLVPILSIGIVAAIGTAVIHETLGPWSAYWCNQFVRSQKHQGEVDIHMVTDHPHRSVAHRRNWFIGEFNTLTYAMKHVEVVQERKDGSSDTRYRAASAKWLDGKWWFQDLEITKFDEHSHPMGPARTEGLREMVELEEPPKDFLNEIRYSPDFLSCRELWRFVKTHPDLSSKVRARYMVDLNYRLAMPWTCVVVTLLGIPFGAQTGRKGAFAGVLLSIGMFFGLYTMINVCLALGKQEELSPFLAGWAPNLTFLILGIILLYRMR